MEKQQNDNIDVSEEPSTVGMLLKNTRLSQRKTLENVCKALCIRKVYIKAIEESNFQELPPVPYGIGFVRSYANYLGLNADRIVQCYKEEAAPTKTVYVNTQKVVKKHPEINIPNWRQILIGIGVLFFFYLLWLALASDKTTPTPTEESEVSAESSVEEISTEDQNANSAAPVLSSETSEEVPDIEEPEEEPEAVIEPTSRVVLKVNAESWIEVKDAQKVYLTGIYNKGFVYNVPDQPGMILSIGRYKDVDVFIDGQKVQVARANKRTNIKLDPYLNH